MSQPGATIPWVEQRFLKSTADGLVPNAGGFISTRETDLTTLKISWTDSALTIPQENPIELDESGRPPSPIYFSNDAAYSIFVYDSDMVLLYDQVYTADYPSIALASSANTATQGTTATASPYTVQTTDNLVLVDTATNPFVVQLPAAADRGTVLYVKNLSSGVVVRVTPDGTETIDGLAAYYSVPAAVSPLFPTVALYSDGVSGWWILSAVGI